MENLIKLIPLFSWDLILELIIKQLLYNNLKEEYNNKNPYIKYRIILIGKLNTFISLRAIENCFSLKKPKFFYTASSYRLNIRRFKGPAVPLQGRVYY